MVSNDSVVYQFSDVLLYTSRGITASNQFKIHGQLPLRGMTVRTSSTSTLHFSYSFIMAVMLSVCD